MKNTISQRGLASIVGKLWRKVREVLTLKKLYEFGSAVGYYGEREFAFIVRPDEYIDMSAVDILCTDDRGDWQYVGSIFMDDARISSNDVFVEGALSFAQYLDLYVTADRWASIADACQVGAGETDEMEEGYSRISWGGPHCPNAFIELCMSY